MPLYTAFARLNDKSDDVPDPNWLPVGSAFKHAKAEDKATLEPEDSAEVLAAASNKGRSLKPTDLPCEISTKSIDAGLPKGIRCFPAALAHGPALESR